MPYAPPLVRATRTNCPCVALRARVCVFCVWGCFPCCCGLLVLRVRRSARRFSSVGVAASAACGRGARRGLIWRACCGVFGWRVVGGCVAAGSVGRFSSRRRRCLSSRVSACVGWRVVGVWSCCRRPCRVGFRVPSCRGCFRAVLSCLRRVRVRVRCRRRWLSGRARGGSTGFCRLRISVEGGFFFCANKNLRGQRNVGGGL